MKKIIFIIMLLISLTGCSKEMTDNNILKSNKEIQVEETNPSNLKEETTENINSPTEETEKEKTEQNNSNATTNKNSNSTISKEQSKTKKDEIKEETPKVEEKQKIEEKHTCTNNDSNYVKWKNQFLSENKSTRLFDTYEEAYNKATEIKDKFYYGFIVQTSPTNYSDNECSKTHYTMQLFVPQGICENNPMIYLPNDINLDTTPLNTIDYLKKIGYECAEKNL